MTAAKSRCHECPGGCGRQVPRHRFACRGCWWRLPARLRAPISATYRRDFGAHLAAMADATDWYRTRHPATDETPTGLVSGQPGRGKTSPAAVLAATKQVLGCAGVPLERFDNHTARVTHGVPAWWAGVADECEFDELYVHSHDRRRVLAAASTMIRANGVDYHELETAETGWCRLVTECGCTTADHDADHDGGVEDCEASGCRFPDLPPCNPDPIYVWQLDRVPETAVGAVAFTRLVLS